MAYPDFVEHNDGQKGMGNIKAAGKFRQEGKNYVVQVMCPCPHAGG